MTYWCTPTAPCHSASPTNDQASTRKSRRSRTQQQRRPPGPARRPGDSGRGRSIAAPGRGRPLAATASPTTGRPSTTAAVRRQRAPPLPQQTDHAVHHQQPGDRVGRARAAVVARCRGRASRASTATTGGRTGATRGGPGAAGVRGRGSLRSAPRRADERRPRCAAGCRRPATATSCRCRRCRTGHRSSMEVSPRSPWTWARPVMPGPHAVAGRVPGRCAAELRDEVRAFGARSDQAHVAPEDVPQLGQLVQRGAPQHPAEPAHPVSSATLHRVAASCVVGRAVGAELQQGERPAVPADALLPEHHARPVDEPQRPPHTPAAAGRPAPAASPDTGCPAAACPRRRGAPGTGTAAGRRTRPAAAAPCTRGSRRRAPRSRSPTRPGCVAAVPVRRGPRDGRPAQSAPRSG